MEYTQREQMGCPVRGGSHLIKPSIDQACLEWLLEPTKMGVSYQNLVPTLLGVLG